MLDTQRFCGSPEARDRYAKIAGAALDMLRPCDSGKALKALSVGPGFEESVYGLGSVARILPWAA